MLSSWSGIRPLASDPTRTSTENIVRDHVVALEGGLITITGGKWTTYRKVRQAAAGKHAVLWSSDGFFIHRWQRTQLMLLLLQQG